MRIQVLSKDLFVICNIISGGSSVRGFCVYPFLSTISPGGLESPFSSNHLLPLSTPLHGGGCYFLRLCRKLPLLLLTSTPPLPKLSIPGSSLVVCRPSRDLRRRRRHPGSGPSSPPRPPRRSYPSAVTASPHRPSPSPGASRRCPPTAARASSHPPALNPRCHLYRC